MIHSSWLTLLYMDASKCNSNVSRASFRHYLNFFWCFLTRSIDLSIYLDTVNFQLRISESFKPLWAVSFLFSQTLQHTEKHWSTGNIVVKADKWKSYVWLYVSDWLFREILRLDFSFLAIRLVKEILATVH